MENVHFNGKKEIYATMLPERNSCICILIDILHIISVIKKKHLHVLGMKKMTILYIANIHMDDISTKKVSWM